MLSARCARMPKLGEQLTSIEIVLNELEEFSRQWEILVRGEQGQFACRRAKPRRKLCIACDIWFFDDRGARLNRRRAVTRNISERGIGLLARCLVPWGSPLEICIAVPGRAPMYLGGVATFCRYTTQGFYEIGLRLEARQDSPIFADDPGIRGVELPWLSQALRTLREEGTQAGTGRRRVR